MEEHQHKLRLALILGSARKGRFCDRVAKWAIGHIETEGAFELDVLDPAAPDVRQVLDQTEGAAPQRLIAGIRRADAFVVVTPEYNHGYPAALKAVIDACYEEWQAKPVAFVSYGGISGGLRAIEQLRQVFAELHTVTVRDTVSFENPWDRFDEGGRLRDPQKGERAIRVMLARLRWWAAALREARTASAYNATM